MSDFDPEDMKSGSLSRYLTDDTEGREERASGLSKYLDTDTDDNE